MRERYGCRGIGNSSRTRWCRIQKGSSTFRFQSLLKNGERAGKRHKIQKNEMSQRMCLMADTLVGGRSVTGNPRC
jgi:hypothetical protein